MFAINVVVLCWILVTSSLRHVYITHLISSHLKQEMHSESTNLRRSGGSRFRTLDSWIRSVIRIAAKIVSLGPWAMPYPSKKFRQNPFTSLRVIRRTVKQTDRQTDWTKNITSFFGGGNELNWTVDEMRLNETRSVTVSAIWTLLDPFACRINFVNKWIIS